MDQWQDDIVEEVRAARDAYAKTFDYDVRAICRDLKKRQASDQRKKAAATKTKSKRGLSEGRSAA